MWPGYATNAHLDHVGISMIWLAILVSMKYQRSYR